METKNSNLNPDLSWNEFVPNKTKCVTNILAAKDNTNIKYIIYAQLNKLLNDYAECLKFAENQYDAEGKNEEKTFRSKFNAHTHFQTAREAKLYDTLNEFFDVSDNHPAAMVIMGMIYKYSEVLNEK